MPGSGVFYRIYTNRFRKLTGVKTGGLEIKTFSLYLYQPTNNIMKKKYKENLLGKHALLFALDCVFDLNRGFQIYLDGYENENDRVSFQFSGHKCKLLEVNSVDISKGAVEMTLLAKGVELEDWSVVRMFFSVNGFRYETLYRIVEECYMCSYACHNDTWADDFEGFIRDKQADWFDSVEQ